MSFKEILYAIYGIVVYVLRGDDLHPESNVNFWWVDWFLNTILGD